jgi:hypothetical protein
MNFVKEKILIKECNENKEDIFNKEKTITDYNKNNIIENINNNFPLDNKHFNFRIIDANLGFKENLNNIFFIEFDLLNEIHNNENINFLNFISNDKVTKEIFMSLNVNNILNKNKFTNINI